MDKQLALEKVPQDIQIRFSFPSFPGADLTTVEVGLPEGALLLDAVRQSGIEHHVPVYLEHSLLSNAQSLIHGTRKATVDQEARRVDRDLFSGDTPHPNTENIGAEQSGDLAGAESELELRRAMIENYRNHTTQFYTQPDENLFPEAYHTLVHSPVPSLFDAILELEREYAGQVDALLSARDAEINDIQARHNHALASEAPQRNLTNLMTQHIERMEVAQATWNSQLDDLQAVQRSKYQEFVLELYAIYKRRRLQAEINAQKDVVNSSELLDGKDMVSEVMRTITERRSNVDKTDETNPTTGQGPVVPSPLPSHSQLSESDVHILPSAQEPTPQSVAAANQETANPDIPPKSLTEEDAELNRKIQPILEMGFDVEQAKGALLIANGNMDHALNLLLEQPDNIPRLVLAKQKADALKENARRQNRAQSSPQQPHPSLVGPPNTSSPSPAPTQDLGTHGVQRPLERSASISSTRPLIGGLAQGTGGTTSQKPWSPLPFFQQQKNALLTNNSSPSVRKIGGWLNRAIENLVPDDDSEDGSSRNSGSSSNTPSLPSQLPPPNLDESFTVVLGSSHSKVTHNLRLMVSDPAEVFPSNRVKTARDAAIHAQTATSLYGQNLNGLVQMVNIRDWAKYKGGQVCHQEFFKACQTSTELHFDSIEKQLEAFEEEFPLDGSTIREGDVVLTRHSNLPMIHVVFHLFYGQQPPQHHIPDGPSASAPTAPLHQLPMFSQPNDFAPKQDFLAGLRNIIKTAHRYEITMLSLPFLMMPAAFEHQLVAPLITETAGLSRHPRRSSHYGSPALSAASTASTASSPSASSTGANNGMGNAGPVYYITDQTRRDLHRRAESLLRHLKSFLMDSARQVKQVGNQGNEAEKFRASQGGDVKVVQFLLPKGTSDDMFRAFRALLVNVFGGV
ncbi:MAG: hypothetical protein J3Q66DRAFT_443072 [Benniella sp.]|nr:MAG: hypothetical protein J3Q66DRAFT_443072 [Benniella sp.]